MSQTSQQPERTRIFRCGQCYALEETKIRALASTAGQFAMGVCTCSSSDHYQHFLSPKHPACEYGQRGKVLV